MFCLCLAALNPQPREDHELTQQPAHIKNFLFPKIMNSTSPQFLVLTFHIILSMYEPRKRPLTSKKKATDIQLCYSRRRKKNASCGDFPDLSFPHKDQTYSSTLLAFLCSFIHPMQYSLGVMNRKIMLFMHKSHFQSQIVSNNFRIFSSFAFLAFLSYHLLVLHKHDLHISQDL